MVAYVAYSLFILVLFLLLCCVHVKNHPTQRTYYTLSDSAGRIDVFSYDIKDARIERRIHEDRTGREDVVILKIIEEEVY